MPDGISDSTVLRAVDHQRVPGVVPALEAHHGGDALGQQIDDLALALVAPLGADDDQVPGHGRRSGFRQADPRTTYSRTAPAIMLASPTARSVRSSSRATCSKRLLQRAGVEERHQALDHQIQRERRQQVVPVQHRYGPRPRGSGSGVLQVLEELAVRRDHQHVALLAERAAIRLQAAIERVELGVAAVGARIDVGREPHRPRRG